VDEFNIERSIRQAFLRRTVYWETPITHWTRHFEVNVLFSKPRPPRRVTLIEGNHRRSHNLGKSAQVVLPDGRRLVAWEPHRPRLYENYGL